MYNTIHIEASGLGQGSYPIEIGIARSDGKRHCTLICPPEDWTHWARPEGEASLSRDNLMINGRSVLKVALLLNEWLGDGLVYSAAWGNDVCWLAALYNKAGVRQRFGVESVDTLFTAETGYTSLREAGYLFQTNPPGAGRRWRASNRAVALQQALCALPNNHSIFKAALES